MVRKVLVDRTSCVLNAKISAGTSNMSGRKTRGQEHWKRNNHQELPACSCQSQRAFSIYFSSFPNQTGSRARAMTRDGVWDLHPPFFLDLGVLRTRSLLGGSSGGYNFLVLVYLGVSGVTRDTLCVLTDFNRGL